MTTPLLIPSVSSRGFPLDADGVAESSLLLHYAEQDLPSALLVSAYDLEHRHLDEAQAFLSSAAPTVLDRPQLLVVDSGGYETGQTWEPGHVDRTERDRQPWSPAQYRAILDALPRRRSVLAVSYDGPGQIAGSYRDQIGRADDLFAPRSHLASDLLLKPPSGPWVVVEDLVGVAADLSRFDVVGVTEKELGPTIGQRLRNLRKLRDALDTAGVQAPLHVFGSLDPVTTPLYYAAGAELFDGLSWLRYRFRDGVAMHPDAAVVLDGHAEEAPDARDARRILSNLSALDDLRARLQQFGPPPQQGFAALQVHADILEDVYRAAQATDPLATDVAGPGARGES